MTAVANIARIIETEAHRLGLILPEPAGSFVAGLAELDRHGKPAPANWLDMLADVVDAIAPSRIALRARSFTVVDNRPKPSPEAPADASPPKPTRSRKKAAPTA